MSGSREIARSRVALPAEPGAPRQRWLRSALPLLVLLTTLAVFSPALRNEFVNWDDDRNLLKNEHFRGLGGPQLRWMFTAYWVGHYHPLTWLSFAVDYEIWGLDARGALGFHLTNVILHALNAVLLYWLAARLLALTNPAASARHPTAVRLAAALAALLFSVHPLRAESVAWVTERRDVLSVFFLLACLLAYLRFARAERARWRWYALALALLLLSLLCKAWGMTLPAVLLVLDWYPLRRFRARGRIRVLAEKIPFVALAAWTGLEALRAQSSALDTMKTLAQYGWLPRIAQAFYGIVFYLWKTLWPTGLIPIYEVPLKLNPFEARFGASAVVVLAITGLVVALRRRWPAGLALWAYYGIVVSPVLGLTQAGPQLVADRYSYLSCMTWAVLAGAGLLYVIDRHSLGRSYNRSVPLAAACAGVILVLAGLTWRQTQVWRSSETLWGYTLAVAPDSYNARTNMGAALQQRGDYEGAARCYRDALAINPDGPDALSCLAGFLTDSGRPEEALPYLQRGLKSSPQHGALLTNLAITLQHLKQYEAAAAIYRQRLASDPSAVQEASLCTGLGATLMELGRDSEGVEYLRRAVALAPRDVLFHYNLAQALRRTGDLDGALQGFEAAIRLARAEIGTSSSTPAAARCVDAVLGAVQVHAARGDWTKARACLREALATSPNNPRLLAAWQRVQQPAGTAPAP